jgi:membrane protein YdbS with pleckstrin-like domain
VSFQSEEYLGRIRKSALSLVFPMAALFLAAAVASYFSNITVDLWLYYTILIACGLFALVFWLVPTIRHLSFYLDLTTSRVTIRQGLFGGKSVVLAWAEIREITFAKGRKVVLQPRTGEPIELEGLPQPKKLAATLRAHL